MKDLECKPPLFIEMRPPAVGLLERMLPVCKVAKGYAKVESIDESLCADFAILHTFFKNLSSIGQIHAKKAQNYPHDATALFISRNWEAASNS